MEYYQILVSYVAHLTISQIQSSYHWDELLYRSTITSNDWIMGLDPRISLSQFTRDSREIASTMKLVLLKLDYTASQKYGTPRKVRPDELSTSNEIRTIEMSEQNETQLLLWGSPFHARSRFRFGVFRLRQNSKWFTFHRETIT